MLSGSITNVRPLIPVFLQKQWAAERRKRVLRTLAVHTCDWPSPVLGVGVLHCHSRERSLRHHDIGHERLIECLRLFHPADYVITTFAGLLLICYRLLPLCVGKLSITCSFFDNKLYISSKIQTKNCFLFQNFWAYSIAMIQFQKKVLYEAFKDF